MIGADTGLPAPGFFLGRSCTCRVRIELQSGELWAAGGLANACLHRKVFQERPSFDQLELQQLFLDLYRPSISTDSTVCWYIPWTPERSFLENVKMPPARTL